MTNYYTAPTEDAAAAARAVGYVQELLGNTLRLLLCNGVHWDVQPTVDSITSADGHIIDSFTVPGSFAGDGTAGVASAPIAAAALVRWRTSTFVGGRRLLGRSFISPIAAGAVDAAGTMDGTVLGNVNSHLTSYLAVLAAGDQQVIWHRPKLGIGGYTGHVVSGQCQDKLAVLTSRRD